MSKASPIADSAIHVATRTAANASHLICWRSSPLARRNRTNNEAAESAPSTTNARNPNPTTASADRTERVDPRSGCGTGTPMSAAGLTAPNRTTTPMRDTRGRPRPAAIAARADVRPGRQEQEGEDRTEPGGPCPAGRPTPPTASPGAASVRPSVA